MRRAERSALDMLSSIDTGVDTGADAADRDSPADGAGVLSSSLSLSPKSRASMSAILM